MEQAQIADIAIGGIGASRALSLLRLQPLDPPIVEFKRILAGDFGHDLVADNLGKNALFSVKNYSG